MKTKNIYVNILTVSDRSFRGEREDKSGPTIIDFLKENDFLIHDYQIVPDEIDQIVNILSKWAEEKIPLI